ncbi:hypothetical protein [Spiroplasma ixodetis]|uniref:Uncharacterized protein n=1 Tax=Spiroplasma ixodetis TaxID=2141 RepID=A0ABM8BRF8_9MOLU|nr:hypothetical protein [Spiroplasma ixodetis]BDT02428.1 hypothetical protein SHM_00740 [Spiroplasma ixodetis]
MNKEKPFSYKDQEIINEYNKKRNQEIKKEHLNNIEKLREDFKKEVINEYKEKIINRILDYETFYIGDTQGLTPFGFIIKLRDEIKNGDFD